MFYLGYLFDQCQLLVASVCKVKWCWIHHKICWKIRHGIQTHYHPDGINLFQIRNSVPILASQNPS